MSATYLITNSFLDFLLHPECNRYTKVKVIWDKTSTNTFVVILDLYSLFVLVLPLKLFCVWCVCYLFAVFLFD